MLPRADSPIRRDAFSRKHAAVAAGSKKWILPDVPWHSGVARRVQGGESPVFKRNAGRGSIIDDDKTGRQEDPVTRTEKEKATRPEGRQTPT
ncbi:hypothetical protein DAEQUDRAFT_729496 [Daedalea quercina L-15889]|uniref:Uncharacterized protein n=1 Tax=Daedalea quercina L-15889 TaxID=1314783 RepID=A0A165NKN3_9APHY|nr:hypothetical protein DAEQUDRAFT_729496 [Daedalea quercina L-15889]